MRRFAARVLFVSLVVAMTLRGLSRGAVSPPAVYQYPLPAPTAVVCANCPGAYHNLPTYPVPANLRFVGRFNDGGRSSDKQVPTRTYRARDGAAVMERNRLYMIYGGSTFASWRADSYPGQVANVHLVQQQVTPDQCCPVLYMPLGSSFDVDHDWETITVDGQNRIGGFDWDDRGYLYVASGPYGWGVVVEDASGMGLLKQVTNPGLVAANNIAVVRSGARYYALVMSGGADQMSVNDVTAPASPGAPSYLDLSPAALAHASGVISGEDAVVVVPPVSTTPWSLRVYRASSLVSGQPPEKSFTSDIAPWWEATFDGQTIYATHGLTTGMAIEVLSAPPGTLNYSVIQSVPLGKWNSGELRTGGGYLTLTARDGSNAFDVRVFKIGADKRLTEIQIDRFFQKYYVTPPPGYARPDGNTSAPKSCVPYAVGSKIYLVYFGYGMGDVYELVESQPAHPCPADLDPSGDGHLTMKDTFYLMNFLFAGGPAPVGNADANGDGKVDGADVAQMPKCLK